MNTRKTMCIILFVASVILAVVSCFVLPDAVVTQISFSGTNRTMPKLAAILLPTVLGAGFALASYFEVGDKKSTKKYLFVSAIGVLVFVMELIVNC